MRQVVLDTETTGLEPEQGHRIIEIGAVEVVDRHITERKFHRYLNPGRDIEAGALEVHGITSEFLQDKPRFEAVVEEFLEFVSGAELVIHNAPFDVAFLDAELARLAERGGRITDSCGVVDTLQLARRLHPGQRNSLDALCARYEVDNSGRDLHGALLDAEILADVYLVMTGGQASLELMSRADGASGGGGSWQLAPDRAMVAVIPASAEEVDRHERYLRRLEEGPAGQSRWRELGLR